ncbi:ATP-binding protein [candidate division WOR-3 bacterium]|nr:ATP-binding protein [candidate division WOR-3 bacterium]
MDEKERISEMIDTIRKLAQGDYSAQVKLTGKNDELDALGMGLNMMIDDIRCNTKELNEAHRASLNIMEDLERERKELRALTQQLQAEITERKLAEKKEKEYIKNLKFLYDAALEFVELVPFKALFKYIGEKLYQLIGSVMVITVSYDEDTGKFTARSVSGASSKTEVVLKFFSKNPVDLEFTIPPVAQAQLHRGKLQKVPNILEKVTDVKISAEMEAELKKDVGLGNVYTMGLARGESLFGFVIVFMHEGVELINKSVVETFINQASIALQRGKIEKELTASLTEKELLLKEIHHRVKNNLQVISSLLNLQARYVNDEVMLKVFANSQSRIDSMALIHERLYKSKDLARVNFEGYLKSLVRSLFESHNISSSNVSLKLDVSGVSLSIDKAIPLGLIINELISNSFEHGFPEGRKGEIRIYLRKAEDRVMLTVADNGVGFPEDHDLKSTDSFGLRLINMLVDQLKGKIELCKTDGSKFNISFSASNKDND